MKVVTICSTIDNDGFRQLKRSTDHFKIELEVIIAPFKFGGQMPYLYNWCKEQKENTDFVYTDAAHDYENVKADILAWLPKVRENGIIAGHDYYSPTPGVIQAVDEIFGEKMNRGYIDELCWMVKI